MSTTEMDFLRVAAAKAQGFGDMAQPSEEQLKEWRYFHDEFFRWYRRLGRPAAYAGVAARLTKRPPPRPKAAAQPQRQKAGAPAPKPNPQVPKQIWDHVTRALAAYARNPQGEYDNFVGAVERALAAGVKGADLPGGAYSIYVQITGGGRYREAESELESMLVRAGL
jgi:hypothetical protein